jgi:hypothetical protein
VSTNGALRARLLVQAWAEIRGLTVEGVPGIPAAVRAVDAGASPEDVATAMTAAAYEAVFRLLFLLSAEHAEEGDGSFSTGWAVVAADLLETGKAVPDAGKPLEFLHEDLLTADPTGQEGQDLFR